MARIAVIDDDCDFTSVIAEILHDEDHTVSSWHHADGAAAHIASERPDLVLLDICLNGRQESGWNVLDQLHEHPVTATIPVIVCSAAVDTLQARQGWLREQHVELLFKPFDIEELLRLIDVCAGQRQAAFNQ